jgi:drug/metabolite transporter (DMT)-like permease
MAIAGRALYAELNTFEIMGYRSTIGFAVVCLLLSLSPGGLRQLRPANPHLHVLRNLFHFTGQNFWFFAVATIPLAQLVALEFTNPLWVALLAPLLLGEHLTRLRTLAIIVGFLGILVVARPGYSPIELGHLAGLGAAVGFAMNTIYTRQIGRTDTLLCVLFWMTLSQAIMGFALAAPGGITLFSAGMIPWVLVVGVCGLTAHFCLTSALFVAPATIVAPMEFGRLPVFVIVGALLYSEPLEWMVLAGGALILFGNLLNLYDRRREGPRNAEKAILEE